MGLYKPKLNATFLGMPFGAAAMCIAVIGMRPFGPSRSKGAPDQPFSVFTL